ncbi:avidin-like [Dromaius novaehollandiae]|uniref:avidin-like n=1 Tax=Dromaius novaehollandiae TaxID=8790 RepID=UPI00311D3E76
MQVAAVLLLLALALATPSSSAEQTCVLTGLWFNDLGSNMTIKPVNEAGEFSGTYHMAVTATSNEIKISPLRGSQHRENNSNQPTFGFTVNWSFSDATSVFVGQCFVDKHGEEILKTVWLLREQVGSLGDDWEATRVGVNVFTRQPVRRE